MIFFITFLQPGEIPMTKFQEIDVITLNALYITFKKTMNNSDIRKLARAYC